MPFTRGGSSSVPLNAPGNPTDPDADVNNTDELVLDKDTEKTLNGIKIEIRVFKSSYEKSADALKEALKQKQYSELEEIYEVFILARDRILETENKLLELLFSIEDNVGVEFCLERRVKIQDEATRLESQARSTLRKIKDDDGECATVSDHFVKGGVHRRKLPKLELPKFSGDVREWLAFWSQFEEIDKDITIPTADKFQYLLQCTVENSDARRIVQSYPICSENYQLALDNLKERYGSHDMLVKVYVRDLLKLVTENAKRKEKANFSSLFVKLSAKIRALGTLGVTTDACASIIYPVVESCLPEEVLRAWQRDSACKEATDGEDELKKLMEFLKKEVRGEDNIRLACGSLSNDQENSPRPSSSKNKKNGNIATATDLLSMDSTSVNKKVLKCLFCEKKHSTEKCGKADSMSLDEKNKILQQKKACYQCLKIGHSSKNCRAFIKCLFCSRKHETIMCPIAPHHTQKPNGVIINNEDGGEKSSSGSTSMTNNSRSQSVLLQTLVIRVHGEKETTKARALIDTGSSKSYILKDLAEELQLQKIGEERVIHGLFGGIESKPQTHSRYKLPVSDTEDEKFYQFDVSDSTRISCDIVPIPDGPWLKELKNQNVTISDSASTSSSIQVLIGADIAGKLLTGKKIELSSGPVAVETKLGWTLMGKLPYNALKTFQILNCCDSNQSNITKLESTGVRQEVEFYCANLNVQDVDISKLWALDTIGIVDPDERKTRTELDDLAMKHFLENVKRNEEGRFEVALPWIQEHAPLPSNKWIAIRRLQTTTTRLKKDGNLQKYNDLFHQWESIGMIEEVPPTDDNFGHYLPHRAVYNPSSTTTPIRPVFDASCRTKGNPSLNECLEKGPNLLEEIPAIITRFRLKKVGVLADIKKAFQQISVNQPDRDFLRFLWWSSLDCTSMKIFRHRRVVFGVNASPFILAATLKHLMENTSSEYQHTVGVLQKSLYVDNVVAAVDGYKEADSFKKEACNIMSTAQFELREWEIGPSASDKLSSLLGMKWNLRDDLIMLDLHELEMKKEVPVTKRSMLALSHSIFDPLGLVSPFTIIPRLLLQEVWQLKTGWDAEVPEVIKVKFDKWKNQILLLKNMQAKRWITSTNNNCDQWTLHVFVDASKSAYAACAFLRVEGKNSVLTELVMSKTRVAPSKNMTIPRLELLSCLIGVRLAAKVKETVELPFIPTVFWSDSTTALHWIKTHGNWGVFVQNRVSEIRKSSQLNNWRHVPGEMNPADLPSRGCSAKQLLETKWWEGPSWLKENKKSWPKSEIFLDEDEVNTEVKKTVTSSLNVQDKDYSNVCELQSYDDMVDYVVKLNGNPEQREVSRFSLLEAEQKLLKMVQKNSFVGSDDKRLKKFQVFTDADGLFRLKTRLEYGDFNYGFKTPIILPPESPVVTALIMKIHRENSHGGLHFMMSTLREDYWIIKTRKTVRNVLKKCVECERFIVKKMQCVTPALPVNRIQAELPFEVTGIDLAGPLYLKNGRKAWLVLFCCAVYRAVHLELVTTLTTEGFMLSLRRFINRRGRPRIIYSDNGTNFVGCDNLFKKINWNKLQQHTICRPIQWIFNPPAAPWWGGWYERLVGVVKQTLRKVLGVSSLSYEELESVLIDVESTVNQRPLTYMSEDPEDLIALSPSMFLIGSRSSNIPEADSVDSKNLKRRWICIQRIRDDLRSRFRKEYLGQLASSKPCKERRMVKVGDKVLIGQDNKKRIEWPLGRITEVFPGRDGTIRRVRVKTLDGDFLRAIQRIYPLEASEQGNSTIVQEEQHAQADQVPAKRNKTNSGRIIKIPERLTYLSI